MLQDCKLEIMTSKNRKIVVDTKYIKLQGRNGLGKNIGINKGEEILEIRIL